MKRNLLCAGALVLLLFLLPACSKDQPAADPAARSIEGSSVWSLAERYPSKYTTITYTVTYEANGEPFCLKVSRSKQKTDLSKHVLASREENGLTYTLREGTEQTKDGKAAYTYYECLTGSFRYRIGRESDGFHIESLLSMDEAIALMNDPSSPGASVTLSDTEWDAYFTMDGCNLDVLLRPNDGGALIGSLSATHSAREENGETIYATEKGDDVAYTNGVDSIRIRQADRAGADHTDYHTLSECREILAYLGSK